MTARPGYDVIGGESTVDEIRTPRPSSTGSYVARHDGAVVISAATYDELCDELERLPIDPGAVVIEYVEPTDRIRVY
jgi:hypothetical protein